MHTSMEPQKIAARLGQFIAGTGSATVPEAVRQEGKRSLLNFVGCALGVARSPSIEMALRVLLPFSGPDQVALLGRNERLDPLGAAFLNAIGGQPARLRRHASAHGHPSDRAGCAGGARAGRTRGLSGAAVLHAFILGAEVECRIGNAVSPGSLRPRLAHHLDLRRLRRRGGSAKLLGLDADADRPCAGHRGEPVGRAWSRICPAPRRTSASATPRGTGCSPHCWRSRATRRRRLRSRARSAGRVRWATSRRSRRSRTGWASGGNC